MRARDSSFLHVFKGRHNNNKKKRGRKNTHKKQERERERRERERERDDFLVLFCDHEDGDGWDDREE